MYDIFQRTRLIAGDDMLRRLSSCRILLVGLGGVGSWCAEALTRSGAGHLTLVDSDCVAPSNINRQLPALHSTIGRSKVQVLAERLRDINPAIDLCLREEFYDSSTAGTFDLDSYDYVIDAIDSLASKAHLIVAATASKARLFSSMGAARKLAASKIEVAEFWHVQGDPLARALRQRFKRTGIFPRRKFKCVFSPELLPQPLASPDGANGTFAHTTAIFGLTLAGLVIEDLYKR